MIWLALLMQITASGDWQKCVQDGHPAWDELVIEVKISCYACGCMILKHMFDVMENMARSRLETCD